MSKYDDAITDVSVTQKRGGWLNADAARLAFQDIDARLSAVEAALTFLGLAKSTQLVAGCVPEAILGLQNRVEALEAAQLAKALASYQPGQAIPAPEQREPGWYPVWREGEPSLWRWSDLGNWVSWDGRVVRAGFPGDKYKIGPRIPGPGQ